MLTIEQKATNADTYKHIHRVRELINIAIKDLLDRSHKHDQCKLESPEVEAFTEHTEKLAASTFNSPEYNERKKLMQPALDHHYANSRHHPEHYKNGVNDMTLFDVLEMLLDWKAASERHNDGNIRKSIEVNSDPKRFNINAQLTRIMENTADYLGW